MTQEIAPKKRTPAVIDKEISELWHKIQTNQSLQIFGYQGSPQQIFFDKVFSEINSLDTEIKTLILLQCPTIQKHINSSESINGYRKQIDALEKEKKAYYAGAKAKQRQRQKELAFESIKKKVGHFILKEQFSMTDSLTIATLTPTEKKHLPEYIANAKKEKV